MNARPTVARWLFLAFSAGLLLAVLSVRQRSDLLRFAEDSELVRLRAERQRLSAFEPAAVRALQTALDTREDRVATLRPWPEGWSVQAGEPIDGSERVSWRLAPIGPPSWSELVKAVLALASVPGNRISSVEIRSRGTLTEREIASVEIVLQHPTAPPSRRNPSGGTVGPGADVPATPPAVGSGPSLRRPSASAEPAAPGQAFAPVRPDPRGPRAGFLSIQKPQPKQP
ncbi:MAG: hypothetical protein PSU94_06410 [Lacunisphaera sp.]|nr:hypothetical protein [Lacunisphaera sp.]